MSLGSQSLESLKVQLKYAIKHKTDRVKELKEEIKRRTPKQRSFRICDNCRNKTRKSVERWFRKSEVTDYCLGFSGELIKDGEIWKVHYLMPDYTGFPFYDATLRIESDCPKFVPERNILDIRTNCYLAILEKKKKANPHAHFEIVTRARENSVLSPSWKLLKKAKEGLVSWEEYKEIYTDEMMNSRTAQQRIKRIISYAKKGHTIFLVCYEKDAAQCHRSILKDIIMKISAEYADMNKQA